MQWLGPYEGERLGTTRGRTAGNAFEEPAESRQTGPSPPGSSRSVQTVTMHRAFPPVDPFGAMPIGTMSASTEPQETAAEAFGAGDEIFRLIARGDGADGGRRDADGAQAVVQAIEIGFAHGIFTAEGHAERD